MIEKSGSYPVYFKPEERRGIESHKALVALTYEQILEIANVMFYFDNILARRPKLFGGVKVDDKAHALHKVIHNSCVNCCLSLEEADRVAKEGTGGQHE